MRAVDPGDWVDPGIQVVELVDDRGVEVLASVPPEVARFLDVGQQSGAPLSRRRCVGHHRQASYPHSTASRAP